MLLNQFPHEMLIVLDRMTHGWKARAHLVAWVGVLLATECHAWTTLVKGHFNSSSDRATAMALYPNGDVVVAGVLQDEAAVVQRMAAIRVDGRTGKEVWRTAVPGAFPTQVSFSNIAYAVALDPSGDVLLGGQLEDQDNVRSFAVAKLSGSTGEILWRHALPDKGSARALIATPQGDAVVVGTHLTESSESLVIVLLSPEGAERWRTEVVGQSPTLALSVALDQFGDILCSGTIGGLFAVLKLDAETGGVLWKTAGPFEGTAHALSFDQSGDVVAAGNALQMGMLVSKFSRVNGQELWHQFVEGDPTGEASSVALDVAGDIVVAGTLQDTESGRLRGVVKLSGSNGMELWRADPPFNFDAVSAVITVEGNVVAVGVRARESLGQSNDFAVAEFSGITGSSVWHLVIPGTAYDVDAATGVALDSEGAVISVGFTREECAAADIFAIKNSLGSGTEVWRARFSGSLNISHDNARALALEGNGDVIVLGETQNSPTCRDITVARLDGRSGRELWRTELTGSAYGSTDRGRALVVNADTDVIVAGLVENAVTGADLLVAKVDALSGEVLWRREVNGRGNGSDAALAITLGTDGHPIVAGTLTETDFSGDLLAMKLDSESGSELWRYILGGSADGFDHGAAIDIGVSGVLALGGVVQNLSTGDDFQVIALDPVTGGERWTRSIEGPRPDGDDAAVVLRVDAAGDVVAGGYLGGRATPAGPVETDLAVVKFTGTDGSERWRRVVSGDAPASTDALTALAFDPAGALLVAGALENQSGSASFTILKLALNTGIERWRYTLAGVSGQPVALAALGNDIIATGFARQADGEEFVAVRVNGDSGDEMWRRGIRGTLFVSEPSRNDTGSDVAVGIDGNVVVAGSTRNGAGGEDITVVKLRGVDGRDFLGQVCIGDCDVDRRVDRSEQLEAIAVALGARPLDNCVAADPSADAAVTIEELVAGTRSFVGVCQLE